MVKRVLSYLEFDICNYYTVLSKYFFFTDHKINIKTKTIVCLFIEMLAVLL